MLLKKSGLKSRVKYGVLIPLFMLTSYIVLAITFNRRVTPKPNGAHTTASENQGILLQKYIAKEITLTAPPFPKTLPNLENREAWKGEITAYVHSLLEGKKNGFFIEAGANDGEFYSNTLALELLSGWTGLLVEPIPTAHTPLLAKRRNAWVANCCLSPEPKATTVC
ncbi:unnamed protein product [Orchesella dallaii]|uniref:Protein Star n=1 Tax=Orchesella dallaii TaxID=48710 RepID=A0ABP1Q945_9HEXA